MCVGVSVWLGWSGILVAGFVLLDGYHPQRNHTETPTHVETRTHDQCGDTIGKPQAPDDGYIYEHVEHRRIEIKLNTSDIKLVFYSSTIHNDARSNIHKIYLFLFRHNKRCQSCPILKTNNKEKFRCWNKPITIICSSNNLEVPLVFRYSGLWGLVCWCNNADAAEDAATPTWTI